MIRVEGFDPQILKGDRLDAGLTLSELERKSGVNRTTIYSWEKGLKCPSAENYRKVLDVLLSEEENRPPAWVWRKRSVKVFSQVTINFQAEAPDALPVADYYVWLPKRYTYVLGATPDYSCEANFFVSYEEIPGEGRPNRIHFWLIKSGEVVPPVAQFLCTERIKSSGINNDIRALYYRADTL